MTAVNFQHNRSFFYIISIFLYNSVSEFLFFTLTEMEAQLKILVSTLLNQKIADKI